MENHVSVSTFRVANKIKEFSRLFYHIMEFFNTGIYVI